jgi:DNA polymerase III subunit delta'
MESVASTFPSTPPSITGHEEQIGYLHDDIRTGNLAHAYILSGNRSLGKFTIAKFFAGEIITENMVAGEKRAHLDRIARNMHPDVLVLGQLWIADICTDWKVIARSSNIPQQHRAKARLKSDTIGIDEIRIIQDLLIEKPASGKMCCIIRSIERLHITAANALLKILEEPPPSCVFCLTTESIGSVPETIVSRARVIPFHPLSTTSLSPLLADLPEEDRSLLLSIAQGCPGIIRRCAEDPEILLRYRQMHIDAHRFLGGTDIERLKTFQDILKEESGDAFLRHVLLHLQEKMRSPDDASVRRAIGMISALTDFQRAQQANAQKAILAPAAALSFDSR